MSVLVHRDGKTLLEELSHTEVATLIKEQEDREKEAETAASKK